MNRFTQQLLSTSALIAATAYSNLAQAQINLNTNTEFWRALAAPSGSSRVMGLPGTTPFQGTWTVDQLMTAGSSSGIKQSGSTILDVYNTEDKSGKSLRVGVGAGSLLATGVGSIAIGYNALAVDPGNQFNTVMGYQAATKITTGSNNLIMGSLTGFTTTAATSSTLLGANAARTSTTVDSSTIVGANAGYNASLTRTVIVGQGTANSTTATAVLTDSVFLGQGIANTASLGTVGSTVAIGRNAGASMTTTSATVLVGLSAGQNLTSGTGNTAVGSSALRDVATGIGNVAVGNSAGMNVTGDNNIILGRASTATAQGGVTSGDRNIVIGFNTTPPSATENDQLAVGNFVYGLGLTGQDTTVSPGKLGIGTKAPNATLTVGEPSGGAGAHIGILGTAPTISSCGTSPSASATASDTAGTVTQGTTATGCTLTFATAFATTPHCVVSSWSANTSVVAISAVSTTALTVANTSADNNKFTYHCLQ